MGMKADAFYGYWYSFHEATQDCILATVTQNGKRTNAI
jgi:hypothetical protein